MFAASLNGALGRAGLVFTLVAATLGALGTIYGIRAGDRRILRLAPRYAWFCLAGAIAAVVMMQRALITRDFSLAYVQQVGSNSTPRLYNIAAMWSALEGSILLWVVILAGYTAAVAWRFRRRTEDPLVGWALAVMFIVMAFFALLSFGPADPFANGAPGVTDGPGPNPLLQNHVLVLFHPPILYLGYVGFTVPFAFAIAALVTGRVGEGWLMETRRWALFAWAFLTIGILLGGWWSYEVLGWSGVWAWDPVENASFLPWLTGTAYIHSVLVQERRGMLRVWNLSLLVATFSLTILGTFLTRSGILSSVHAFGDGPVGAYLLTFFGLVVAVSLALIGWRGDRLRAPGTIDSPVSREGAFLANNVLFTVFAFVVLLGTVFPLLVEALQDRRTVVGAPYFDRLSTPIGLALLFLMAVAPVLPWRKASLELLRDRLFWPAWCGAGALVVAVLLGADGWAPLVAFGLAGAAAGSALRQLVLATRRQGWRGLVGRANGGMIVHLGVILIAVALVASNSYTPVGHAGARRRPRAGVGRPHLRPAGRARDAGRAHPGRRRRRAPRRRPGVPPGQHQVPAHRPGHRDAERADRAGQRRVPHARAGRRAGCRLGHDPRVRQAVDPVVVDRRRGDGDRDAARRLPRISPPPPDRSGVGRSRCGRRSAGAPRAEPGARLRIRESPRD